MATKIAEAYVQIKPTTKGIKNELESQLNPELESAGKTGGQSMGAGLVSTLKSIIVAAGIGTMIKEALDAGGAVQQSFGGLDTLYGEASEAAKQYARDAAAAGISMNDYAEQAVSFGAALKQAFNGDVEAAAKAANTAIMDMADNSAKMGTDLAQIQSAYQGFAKQNYTMLDNLKLGYGGTKTEMERLLKDAEKISGVKYDMDNLGDVYEAIHVIQTELGLTGVAAEEASSTFTGSMQAMAAAGQNLLADIALGNTDALYGDIQTLLDSAISFIANNAAPMVANILSAVPQLLANLMYEVGQLLISSSEDAGVGVNFVIELFADMAEALVENLPYLLGGILQMAIAIGDALLNYDWLGLGTRLIKSFQSSISDAIDFFFGDSNTDLLTALVDWITNTMPEIQKKGVETLFSFINGLLDGIPGETGKAILEVIASILEALLKAMPDIIKGGFELLTAIITGILNAIPKLIEAIPRVIEAIIDTFGQIEWKEIGINIIQGIIGGIKSSVSAIADAAKEAAKSALDSAKNILGIHSPSKVFADEVGKMIPEGVAVGVESNLDSITSAMEELTNETLNVELGNADYIGNVNAQMESGSNEDVSTVTSLLARYLPALANMRVVLDSGELVGGTVAKMNDALGELYMKDEKGVAYS